MAPQTRLRTIFAVASRCAQPAVWVLWAAGIAAFLLLPLAAKRCYLDEKALLVGGALPSIRQSGALDACVAAYNQLQAQPHSGQLAPLVQAAAAAAAAGSLHLYHHNFTSSGGQQCSTLHSVVRSPRGDGSEGFALLMPLDGSNRAAAALAAAVGGALAGHLRSSGWLAKDAVLVFTDAACGMVEGAEEWLAAYNSGRDLFGFPRAGLLQQALVLELTGTVAAAGGAAGAASAAAAAASPRGSGGSAGWAELSVHGSGGQLPNLDLYYLLKRNLDMHTTLPVSLRPSSAPLPPAVQRGAAALGSAAAALGLAGPTAAQWYATELQNLAAFSMQLAGGEPTGGGHSAFLSRHIDAAALRVHLEAAGSDGGTGTGAATAAGSVQARHQLQLAAYSTLAAAEMVLRTFNNLQERLHHSTALYVLVSPDRFASVALYLAPPACLLAAALVQLVVASRAAGLPPAAWHAACRWVAAAVVLAAAVSPASRPVLSVEGLLVRVKQGAWAAAAGLAAAEGPAALLAALRLDSSGPTGPDRSAAASKTAAAAAAAASAGSVRRCTLAVGLAALVLQAAYCIITRWVACCALLLAAVPLYSLAGASLYHDGSGSSRLAAMLTNSLLLPGAAGLCYTLAGSAWLTPLLPHILVAAAAVWPSRGR